MTITSEQWQLLCRDVAHKQELLAYAAECGVKVAPAEWGHYHDADLYLNYWSSSVGIGSLAVRHQPGRGTTLIGWELFKTMCAAYAETTPLRSLLMST